LCFEKDKIKRGRGGISRKCTENERKKEVKGEIMKEEINCCETK
jgi:hypothetical protein